METARIWLDKEWVEFPISCLRTNADTKRKWIRVLESLEAVTEPDKRPRRVPKKITDHYNSTYGASLTEDTVRSILDRIKRKVRAWLIDKQFEGDVIAEALQARSDATVEDAYRAYLGWTNQHVEAPLRCNDSARRLVVVIADLHGAPNPEVLNRVIQQAQRAVVEGKQVVVVLAGDIYDLFCNARAGKINGLPFRAAEKEAQEQFHWETVNLVAFMQRLTEAVPGKVYILRGNHDALIQKFFGPTPFWVLKTFVQDPLEALANQFENVEMAKWTVPYVKPTGEVIENYQTHVFADVYGDLLVSHMNMYGETGHKKLWKWVNARRIQHKLGHIRVALQAHAHRGTLEPLQGGHVWAGMCGFSGDVKTLNYQIGYQPWLTDCAPGYVSLEQRLRNDQWRTVYGSVRFNAC